MFELTVMQLYIMFVLLYVASAEETLVLHYPVLEMSRIRVVDGQTSREGSETSIGQSLPTKHP